MKLDKKIKTVRQLFTRKTSPKFVIYSFLFLNFTHHTINAQTIQIGPGLNDIDGNFYSSIIYGNGQEWMGENLKSASFANGDPIPNVTSANQWYTLTTASWAIYNDNSTLENTYGKLYNFYTIADSRGVCPSGWNVPSRQAFDSLINYLGGSQTAGGFLKETGLTHWNSPNSGATNQSVFNALPNGIKMETGTYSDIGQIAYFWSSTADAAQSAIRLNLFYNNSTSNTLYGANKNAGLGIRCLRLNNNVGLEENSDDNLVILYPNPTNDFFNLKSNKNLIGSKYEILDNLGRIVLTGVLLNENQIVDMTELSRGIYNLQVMGASSKTLNFVKN
jgi:uncharacterized protein (TIGR02145 family)